MLRNLRKAVEAGIPILGMLIVLGAVLFLVDPSDQIPVVVLGLLVVEAGVWGLARPILPSERKYNALRDETDRFVNLVRTLNAAAVAWHREQSAEAERAFDAVHAELRSCLDRIVTVAGRTDQELQRQPLLVD